MKQFIKNIKIKHKLIIIIMSTVVVSLLLAGSVLIVSERYLAKQSMVDKLTTISRIIADRSTAALSFNDKQVAQEVLSALDNESSVILGCIYDATKTIFSVHGDLKKSECPSRPEEITYRFIGEKFELYQVIKLEGEIIGTVYILATLDKLNEHVLTFIIFVFLMTCVVGVMAYFLANRQQEIISKPILELTKFAHDISITEDYTARLPMKSRDEIGSLNLAFNNMLEKIDKRKTERDKAEKELSEREQDLAVTLNSIGDAVIVTDINGRITRMNPVAEKLTGWAFEEASDKPIENVLPIINATTQQPIENPVKKVVSTGETVYLSSHIILITKKSKKIHIEYSAAPIRNKRNEMLGMILVFSDVTEKYNLREAAAKSKRNLQAIMDNSPASIYVEDRQGKFIFVNQQFANVFQIKYGKIINKTMHDIFPQETAEKMQRFNQDVLISGKSVEAEEIVLQEDGDHIFSSIKFPLFDEKNKIYAMCSISTDITERRVQEEQLRRSQKMDALGKLTGGIAHDYNNLLGVIIGYSELLNEKINNNELLKYVNDIEHAAQRGAKLTKKLLAFTRQKNADEILLNINELILDGQMMLEKTLTARIVLKLKLEENLWPVWIDGGDLEDAIINMCINASHAINGNGEITFQTRNEILNEENAKLLHIKAGNYILLSISDTGTGMDDLTREKIFDPFFSTKGEAGNGLGLSQVYGFVKRSGGDIKVYSTLGQGTQFVMYFPKSNLPVSDSYASLSIKNEELGGNETILIVDDEPSLVALAKAILTAQGYSVLTADSAEHALNMLDAEDVNLILSDVIMSGMNGYQLAEKVKKQHPNIKMQLVSGFSGVREDNIIADEILGKNILHKPYVPAELLKSVRSILDDNLVKNIHVKSKKGKTNYTARPSTSSLGNILIMDDEDDVKNLFVISLEGLGYETLTASNSEEAIEYYKKSLNENKKIDAMILDLNIPGGLAGSEVALKVRQLNDNIKLIVCSGDTACSEMTDYKKFGFDGALEKTFNIKKIKTLLNELLF